MKSIISLLVSTALLSSGLAFADDTDAQRADRLKKFNLTEDQGFASGTDKATEYFNTGNLLADGIAGSFAFVAIFITLKLGANANGNGTGGTIGSSGPTGSSGMPGSTGTTSSMGTGGTSGTSGT